MRKKSRGNFKWARICAEKFPWKCHRSFIAQELEKKKIKVIHIIEKEKIWEPEKEPREIKPKCQKRLLNFYEMLK